METTRAGLAILLSKLKAFKSPKMMLEQYPTDSETAATILWDIYIKEGISDRTIADFGAGTGILGIGMLILGAKKVYFVEKDDKAISILKENINIISKIANINKKKAIIMHKDIAEFNKRPDIIIQNPPFGTKAKHADIIFLKKAFLTAKTIYSIHKTSTIRFIKKFSEKNGFEVKEISSYLMPIKKSYAFHKKAIKRIEISCLKIEKKI